MSVDLKHPFVMFPARIWNLPGITLQLVKFYEKIFQFWHQRADCFVNNKTLKEYSGMLSDSSISEAFRYFENLGEMRRVTKNGRRYISQPIHFVGDETISPVDNFEIDSTNNSQGLAVAREGSRCGEGGGLAAARHNKRSNNNININKSSCLTDEQKETRVVDNYEKPWLESTKGIEQNKPYSPPNRKAENEKRHSWANKADTSSPFANVQSQSTSYNATRVSHARSEPSPLLAEYMRNEAAKAEKLANETREVPVPPQTPVKSSVIDPGSKINESRCVYVPEEDRGSNDKLEAISAGSYLEAIGVRQMYRAATG